MRIPTLCLLVAVLAVSPAATQVTVTNLSRDLEVLTETADVRCTLFASFEEAGVVVGMQLEPGDLLASASGDVDLELTCPNGSLLRFSGSFRVLINPPEEGSDCAVNFLSGTLDVLTDQPTEVNAGGIVLGTEGTQYSVELIRGEQGVEEACSVYDGRVKWRTREVETQWLDGGRRLDWNRGQYSEDEVGDAELNRVARRQARFDASKSMRGGGLAEDPKAMAERLARLHYDVLTRPGDIDRRVELAKAQIDYQISGQATYHLGRAGIRTDEQMKSHQIDVDRLKAAQVAGQTPSGAQPGKDPFALIEQKRYREALQILESRTRDDRADSRDFCGLARSIFHLEGAKSRRAVGFAKRAVSANARDRKTPADELELCSHLAR